MARALLCENLVEEEPCNQCGNCLGILNGNSEAFVEQDAASHGTTDAMRAIVDDLPFRVPGAAKRIYLFDEAHRMSKDAQDVLLKPIEEGKMVCMFCTTEPEKIRGTIRSRCEAYNIRRVAREEIATRMEWVLTQEKVAYEPDAILTVVDYFTGHVRDILNRLEMLGLMGPITVQAVQEHLNLGVVSTYYQILLSLGEPAKSVPLVEEACDRVGSDEVATGLAEAAMNAFRQAHGMHTDYALSDRKLGEQAYQLHGESIVQLANYFLQAYKPSRISLVCDVIRCAKGVPALGTAPTAPPVVVMAHSATAQGNSHASPAQVNPNATPPPGPIPTMHPPKSLPAANINGMNGTEKIRSDGVGSLGTSDFLALTELDHKVVKEALPRGAQQRQASEKKGKELEGAHLVELLPSNQWRHEFEEAWLSSRNGNGV
jgi:DNA polymerase III gamma/tau subunit